MKRAGVTVYPDRIEWTVYKDKRVDRTWVLDEEHTGSEPVYLQQQAQDAWGRVMTSLTGHEVDEMKIRYEKEN